MFEHEPAVPNPSAAQLRQAWTGTIGLFFVGAVGFAVALSIDDSTFRIALCASTFVIAATAAFIAVALLAGRRRRRKRPR
jgi:MYXO-CTERM domain-containing protein